MVETGSSVNPAPQEDPTINDGFKQVIPAAPLGTPSTVVLCDELVEFCSRYACLGYKKYALKKKIEDELKITMSVKTFEVLRVKIKEYLQATLLSPEEHRVNAVEIIYQIIQDENTHGSTRLRAAEILLTSAAAISPDQDSERKRKIREILAGIDLETAVNDPDD